MSFESQASNACKNYDALPGSRAPGPGSAGEAAFIDRALPTLASQYRRLGALRPPPRLAGPFALYRARLAQAVVLATQIRGAAASHGNGARRALTALSRDLETALANARAIAHTLRLQACD